MSLFEERLVQFLKTMTLQMFLSISCTVTLGDPAAERSVEVLHVVIVQRVMALN